MRAIVFDETLHFDPAYPQPDPAPGDVLIRVRQAGICNTDMELVKGYMGFSGVLGHEFVGETPDGQRVVGEINIVTDPDEPFARCGIPSQSASRVTLGIDRKDGAFADYLTLPTENLHPVPDPVSDEQAVFVEPLAAGLQTLHMTHISPHERVVLIGAGKLGLLTAQVVALTGCELSVVCRHARQAELVTGWGIDAVGEGDLPPNSADIVIDCTGSQGGFAAALELVKPRGVLHLKSTYAGLPEADLTRLVVDEISVEVSRCGPFPAALRLLARGLIHTDALIDARYPLDEGVTAFEHAQRPGVLKVLLAVT
ncbi:MAG: alcohol dehydrogenase catalytic domain-containing protein [Chloroflexi bacterium]|nr:alcohol dehydrogenase catalytic domain-containing protein [Chloroflexota bacterium]